MTRDTGAAYEWLLSGTEEAAKTHQQRSRFGRMNGLS